MKDERFATWHRNSVPCHKQPGYAIVTISLKPIGAPPGDATADQMDLIADLADRYGFREIRVGHEQNLCLPNVAQQDLPALWAALDAAEPRHAERQSHQRHHRLPRPRLLQRSPMPGRSRWRRRSPSASPISSARAASAGCMSTSRAASMPAVITMSAISAYLGVEKNGQEFYQITIGGRADEKAQIGTLLGPAVPYEQVPGLIEDIVDAYMELREGPKELFVDTVHRLGVEPFKERVYATH